MFWNCITKLCDVNVRTAVEVVDDIKWMEFKRHCAKETINYLLEEKKQLDDDDRNDSDDDEEYDDVYDDVIGGKEYFQFFFENLPSNQISHLGGFCPCSNSELKWRDQFVNNGCEDKLADMSRRDRCGNNRGMNQQGLMQHMKDVGRNRDAVLHRGLSIYLNKLSKWSNKRMSMHESNQSNKKLKSGHEYE